MVLSNLVLATWVEHRHRHGQPALVALGVFKAVQPDQGVISRRPWGVYTGKKFGTGHVLGDQITHGIAVVGRRVLSKAEANEPLAALWRNGVLRVGRPPFLASHGSGGAVLVRLGHLILVGAGPRPKVLINYAQVFPHGPDPLLSGTGHAFGSGQPVLLGRYLAILAKHGLVCSMSGKGNCYDNACAERFFHTLKVEMVHGESFAWRGAMRRAVFEYIEVDYNRARRHSANGYISPTAFETQMVA